MEMKIFRLNLLLSVSASWIHTCSTVSTNLTTPLVAAEPLLRESRRHGIAPQKIETESVTSSMMSTGDNMGMPNFVFTSCDDGQRIMHHNYRESQGVIAKKSRRTESDSASADYASLQMNTLQKPKIESTNTDENMAYHSDTDILPSTAKELRPFSFPCQKYVSAPPSPGGINYRHSTALNNLLAVPSAGSFGNISPKPLRRTLSARDVGSSSTKIRKTTTCSSPSITGEFYGDSISAIVPVGNEEQSKQHHIVKRELAVLMSCIYAVFILMLGAIIFISDQNRNDRLISEVFSTCLAVLGILWLIVFHVDLCIYKKEVLRQLMQREDAIQEASEKFSTATEFIINSGYNFSASRNSSDEDPPPFRFLQGRHSGSFYLKIGSAAFCFGYLIYQGLQLGQHILNFIDDEKKQLNCQRLSSIVLHVVSPLCAFYQLFITFKYSNIVINRHKALARFGLMHLIATCLCNWFSTIVEEAVEDYTHRNISGNPAITEFDIAHFHIIVERKGNWSNPFHCTADSILSTRSMSAIPYLYPFAIEYNILLAGVWFVVWQNIGKEHMNANPHHIRHTISHDESGSDEITYQSNLVISADCHSANKGLFVGLFLLLIIIVTVIVFFVAMTTKGYEEKAISIHTAQEGVLTFIAMFSVCIAFYQIRKLDLSEHPITFLDDVLLFIPLPFFFVHGIMSVLAEYANESYTRLGLHVLVTVQVMVQTPFIIDGLRRCSKAQNLRYKKPGREVITFLIILNLTLWVVNTFELKSVEHYHGQEEYFGDLIWMFIGHTTLPLMLFYRFHSSVCLADMWKSAYEKER